ncbi:hypothetical protein [Thauera humireducens]|uniref:hypothetical protein n=1 Tax=Thauera humireducens TaxID=1134435 RepID=UPI0031202B26
MNPLPWMHHLIIVPVLLPLLVGALLIPVNQKRHARKFAFSVASGALLWGWRSPCWCWWTRNTGRMALACISPRTGRRRSASC